MCICLLRECKLVVIKCFPKHLIGFKIRAGNVRLTSITSTLLFGGIKFVLLAMQTNRAFTCCRPIFGYDKWFTVTPSWRCSNDSSITVLSKYHVTFGRGRPKIMNERRGELKNMNWLIFKYSHTLTSAQTLHSAVHTKWFIRISHHI